MSDVEARNELYELTRALRLHLERLQRAGVSAVPAGQARRAHASGSAYEPAHEPMHEPPGMHHGRRDEGRAARHPGGSGAVPGQGPHGAGAGARMPGGAPDRGELPMGAPSMSEALAALLGESAADTPRAAAARRQAAEAPAQAPQPPSPPPAPVAPPEPARPAYPAHAQAAPAQAAQPAQRRLSLAEIRAELGDCQRCKLAPKRQHIVFGTGDSEAALMFVGEAPGADEDRSGEPFVGAAGQLLDKMIQAMGWNRQTVYITNVVKCRPPGNRTPEADEVDACRRFLDMQIAAVRPRIIVALGRSAAQSLLRTTAPIHSLRGSFQSYRGIKVMPTFHPAFLLRNGNAKREAWNDLQKVIAELERLGIRSPAPPKVKQ